MSARNINISIDRKGQSTKAIEQFLEDNQIKAAMMNFSLMHIDFEIVTKIEYELVPHPYTREGMDVMVLFNETGDEIATVYGGEPL